LSPNQYNVSERNKSNTGNLQPKYVVLKSDSDNLLFTWVPPPTTEKEWENHSSTVLKTIAL
jgi:hypothetical protein